MALAPIIKANAQLINAGAAPQAPGVSVRNYQREEDMQRRRDELLHKQRMAEQAAQLGARASEGDRDRAWRGDQAKADRDWRTREREAAQDHAIELEELREDHRIDANARSRADFDYMNAVKRGDRDADLIAAGTHEYGYSPEVQREYDKLMENYNRGLSEGRYTADSPEGRQFKEELDRQIAALPKTLVPRNDPEGTFKRNTFTDAQGRIFTTDGKMIYNPADAETRRMEFQQRQMDAMRSAADRLYTELKKPRKVTRMTEIAGGGEEAKDFYEERSDDEVMRIMQERYPQLFPAPPAQPAPAAQQPSPFQQALQSWWQGMRGGGAGAQPAQPAPTAAPTSPAPTPAAQPATAAAAEPPASAAKRTTQPGGAVDWKELWK